MTWVFVLDLEFCLELMSLNNRLRVMLELESGCLLIHKFGLDSED